MAEAVSSKTNLPPPPPAYRWLVLVVISLAMFGNYYVYDSLNPLEDLLLKTLGIGADQYGRLFSIYSLPNLVMLIVSGVFIDRIGARKATFIFAAICAIGALLTAAGAWSGYWTLLAGRFFFGLGAESLIVAVTAAIARWFKGKELSFAFGINLTIARLGSFAADWSPTWAKPAFDSLQGPLLIAVAFASVSIVAAIAYWVLEDRGLKRYDLGMAGATDKIDFKSVFSFGKTYWFVVAMCATFYSAVFPFRSFASKFFQQTHDMSLDDASALNSSLIIGAMIFTPLFGLLVDKVGRRATLMVIGTLVLLPNYFLLTNAAIPPQIPMLFMGLSFALVPAVMWPSVAYLAPEKNLGTALGIMTMIQQVGMMAIPAIVGYVNASSTAHGHTNYTPMMAIFTSLVAVGFIFSLLLFKAERGPKAQGLETITTHSRLEQDTVDEAAA